MRISTIFLYEREFKTLFKKNIMNDFALLFRQPDYQYSNTSKEKMEELEKRWKDWVTSIATQGKLVNPGIRLSLEGKVLKNGGVITDGPFVEIKEKLGGLIIIKADDLGEATTIAHGCPALETDGCVEIRPIRS